MEVVACTPFIIVVSTEPFSLKDAVLELIIVVVPTEPARFEVKILLEFVRVLVADKLLIVALLAPKFTTPIFAVLTEFANNCETVPVPNKKLSATVVLA